MSLICEVEGCGKRCKTKAGLAMYQKKMHKAMDERVTFTCERCGKMMDTEGVRTSHVHSALEKRRN